MQRSILFGLLVLTLLVGPLAAPVTAQDDPDPLLALLAYIPRASETASQLVVYGDFAAWHAATGIPRVDDIAAVQALPDMQRAWWLFVMPRQLAPPEALGIHYLAQEDMRASYGFDLFAVERFIATDAPPSNITVIDTALEPAHVGSALLATGYEALALDGGTLYHILDDYETALGANLPRVGILGALNRIAVLDDATVIIARATDLVQGALDAQQGAQPSLAEDPRYRAAAAALHELSLSDVGPLVGALFSEGMIAGDPAVLLGAGTTEEKIAALEEQLAATGSDPLPPYMLTAFGTFRGEGATFLALAVVLLPGADAQAATDTLGARMTGYVSLTTGEPISPRWAFDRAFATAQDDLPVAVVVMRVDDPPAPEEGEQPSTAILAWQDLIYRRDLGFLVPGG